MSASALVAELLVTGWVGKTMIKKMMIKLLYMPVNLVASMLGGWLKQDTSVKTVADFAEKVFVQRDFDGFSGDEGLIQNDYAKRLFSKLRSSIGGVYAWRAAHSTDAADAQRMTTEADLAFRRCPLIRT